MNTLKIVYFIFPVLDLEKNLNAQFVTKNVIIEHFTNTKCSICASRNPGFYSALVRNPDVLHIAYHPAGIIKVLFDF